ncbi:uncharacterized protein LOC132305029 [Cornus florida]|uniref:uncharacterized protein LOC132305029 n=1 Tax=Cornus florida TaxID=4283 RepID=UPI002898468B|nr:uncharacterized protein LOC132305029 [Cornus florida]
MVVLLDEIQPLMPSVNAYNKLNLRILGSLAFYTPGITKVLAQLVLANKLQLALPHIIDHTQTTFVQGRKITDSVLLTHELLRGYHRDIPPPRTPRFRYHWRCKELGITHFSFEDDLFLFFHGDITSVSILKSALDHFCTMSGLSINLSKSLIFLSGVDPSTEAAILNLPGINTSSLPIRHLGVPLISTYLRAADCRPLIERITHTITHWTSRSLSYAGRLQLIKSVLVSTQVYWSSIFILPKVVFDEINRILMAFLWSGIEMKSTSAKIA